MKHQFFMVGLLVVQPAAFGRLCVETAHVLAVLKCLTPAAFGRLCVETIFTWDWQYRF